MEVLAALAAAVIAAMVAGALGQADQFGVIGAAAFGAFFGLALVIIFGRKDEIRRSWWIGGAITALLFTILSIFNQVLGVG